MSAPAGNPLKSTTHLAVRFEATRQAEPYVDALACEGLHAPVMVALTIHCIDADGVYADGLHQTSIYLTLGCAK